MRVSLVTLGDPETLTGGYLYHRRLAELAPRFDAELRFVSFRDRPFPLARLEARGVRQQAFAADAVVLDSIAAAFWGTQRQRPVLVMAHQPPGGIDHGRVRSKLQALLDRRAYRSLTIMVASDDLATQMVGHGIERGRLVVVPPGRDVAEPDPTWSGDLRGGRAAAVLCVGNWVRRKGITELLEAVRLLPDELVMLHLVGNDRADEAYATEVRARLEDPALRDRVVVHGPQPKEVVAAMYRAADVFALASVREPYGTVYGEAMAMGLPVVGWRAGNLPHLARDREHGLIVPPGDVHALAGALQELASDARLRARLASNALERAASFPTWEEVAELFFSTVRAAL